jgi:ABC-type multidrug transport system ATPase subunit
MGRFSEAAAAGAAVAMATTYLDEAERASSVLVLDAGHTVASGTGDELIRSLPGTISVAGGLVGRTHQNIRRDHADVDVEQEEVPLTGGRIVRGVVRVGDAVHRPMPADPDYVHELEHLERNGNLFRKRLHE